MPPLMWSFFHKLGSPTLAVFGIAGSDSALAAAPDPTGPGRWALTWGLLFTSPDFRQGNSYRIIYIHVPSAVVALAGYYVMAIAGAVSLIWRMKMADVAMKACGPHWSGPDLHVALFTGADVG